MPSVLTALALLCISSLALAPMAAAGELDLDFELQDEELDWGLEDFEDLEGVDLDDPFLDFEDEPADDLEDPDFEPFEDLEDDPLAGLPELLGTDDMAMAETMEVTGAPLGMRLGVVGKQPLADNYAPRLVAIERAALVVELPVLLGRSRAAATGGDYWLQAELLVDGVAVTASGQHVTRAGMAEFGPSFAFFKLLAPISSPLGELQLRLTRLEQLGGEATALFTRSLPYDLR